MRVFLAFLAAASGVERVASLWLVTLTEAVVSESVVGAAYLIIAIGLFGQSRFSLFMAVALPATVVLYAAFNQPTELERLRMAADTVISIGSLILLWRTRHLPGT